MQRLLMRFALPGMAALSAIAAVAPAYAAEPVARDGGTDIVPVVLWSLVGVGIFATTLGVFYLFKRRIGAFPRNPAWVAPISIMPSKDLPGDVDTHEAFVDVHAGGHGDPHAAAAHH
jgi:hypothetical protein